MVLGLQNSSSAILGGHFSDFCVVDHGMSSFDAGGDRALDRGRQGLFQFFRGGLHG